jgi:hypothetical protein
MHTFPKTLYASSTHIGMSAAAMETPMTAAALEAPVGGPIGADAISGSTMLSDSSPEPLALSLRLAVDQLAMDAVAEQLGKLQSDWRSSALIIDRQASLLHTSTRICPLAGTCGLSNEKFEASVQAATVSTATPDLLRRKSRYCSSHVTVASATATAETVSIQIQRTMSVSCARVGGARWRCALAVRVAK